MSPRKLTSLMLMASVAFLAAGCANGAKAGQPSGPQAFPVQVITAKSQVVPFSTDYLATLKFAQCRHAPAAGGRRHHQNFCASGQTGCSRRTLLEIDPRKQQATVNNQEAGLKSKQAVMQQAAVDLDRKKKLYAAGVLAKADLDTAQNTYDAAKADAEALQAAIREQQVQLHYYTVRAPSAGVIGDIPVHVGDHVSAQTMLTTVDQGGALEAYLNVPAEKSSALENRNAGGPCGR